MRRRLVALHEAYRECVAFFGKLGGDVLPPTFATEEDEHEHALLGNFLAERAGPLIRYWSEAIDAVDAGASLAIKPGDIPPWPCARM